VAASGAASAGLAALLQSPLRNPPLPAGTAMAPRGVGSLIAMPSVGVLMSRIDPRKLLTLGFLLGAWTMFRLATFDLTVGYWDIFWPQFIQGITLGLMFVPLTTITMDRITREYVGNATSLLNLVRNVGGSAARRRHGRIPPPLALRPRFSGRCRGASSSRCPWPDSSPCR
jgi:DHA2 family multidrug resistance protein